MLGHLVWWRVVGASLNLATAEEADLGLDLPSRPLPHDVYRRVTGNATMTFTLVEDEATLSCAPVKSTSAKVIDRDIVLTSVTPSGKPWVVGHATFYYPPRGKNSKARFRVSTTRKDIPELQQFASQLREDWVTGLGGLLDEQGIRRLARTHVLKRGLYLDGPYFVRDEETVAPLRLLFTLLEGEGDCFVHSTPMVDTPENRTFLSRGVERAVAAKQQVDEGLWSLLEGSTHGPE